MLFYWYIIVDYHDWYVVPVLLHDLCRRALVCLESRMKVDTTVYCHGDTV